jgi:hypothetical protein
MSQKIMNRGLFPVYRHNQRYKRIVQTVIHLNSQTFSAAMKTYILQPTL